MQKLRELISHLINLRERERLASSRIGQKRKSFSRNSYEDSSGNGRIEKVLLYRSWKSATVGKSTVNQLVVQNHELQDKMNKFSERFQGVLCS